MSDEAIVLQVSQEILDYMRRFPDAADTEEHISRWWLSVQDDEEKLRAVTHALRLLEREGLIEHVSIPGNEMVYRMRKIPGSNV